MMPAPRKGGPKSVALSLGLSAVILYLTAHAVTGQQGLMSYMELQEQHEALLNEKGALAREHTDLEVRLKAMGSGRIDKDALEELARRQFAAAHPDEIVFELDETTAAQ
jgi:cell division protein FtsB